MMPDQFFGICCFVSTWPIVFLCVKFYSRLNQANKEEEQNLQTLLVIVSPLTVIVFLFMILPIELLVISFRTIKYSLFGESTTSPYPPKWIVMLVRYLHIAK